MNSGQQAPLPFASLLAQGDQAIQAYIGSQRRSNEDLYKALEAAYLLQQEADKAPDAWKDHAASVGVKITKATEKNRYLGSVRVLFSAIKSEKDMSDSFNRYANCLLAVEEELDGKLPNQGEVREIIENAEGGVGGLAKKANEEANHRVRAKAEYDEANALGDLPYKETIGSITMAEKISKRHRPVLLLGYVNAYGDVDIKRVLDEPDKAVNKLALKYNAQPPAQAESPPKQENKDAKALNWMGSKKRMMDRIIHLIPQDCIEYREPFAGGGSAFKAILKARNNFKKVWINDFDAGVACFWMMVRDRPEDLIKEHKQLCDKFAGSPVFQKPDTKTLSYSVDTEIYKFCHSFRAQYKEANAAPSGVLPNDPFSFAVAFFFRNSVSMNGCGTPSPTQFMSSKDHRELFGIKGRGIGPDYFEKKYEEIRGIHKLLVGAKVTRLDYEEVILAPTKNRTFLFMDPPYDDSDSFYAAVLKDDGNAELRNITASSLLTKINNKWLFSPDKLLQEIDAGRVPARDQDGEPRKIQYICIHKPDADLAEARRKAKGSDLKVKFRSELNDKEKAHILWHWRLPKSIAKAENENLLWMLTHSDTDFLKSRLSYVGLKSERPFDIDLISELGRMNPKLGMRTDAIVRNYGAESLPAPKATKDKAETVVTPEPVDYEEHLSPNQLQEIRALQDEFKIKT